jgi:hypothetical protein
MSQTDLPLPQYDDLTVGEIESRVRTLDPGGVEALITYERAHAARPQVLLVLENRAEQLRDGAEPTGGSAEVPGAGEPHDPGQATPTSAPEDATTPFQGVPGGSSVARRPPG